MLEMQQKISTGLNLNLPEVVIFDWDCTLVSTWDVLRYAYNETLIAFGKEDQLLGEKDFHIMNMSLRNQFPKLFGQEWEKALEILSQHYNERHLDHIKPMPGAVQILDYLSERQVPCFVVSNKRPHILRIECDHLGWNKYFKKIVGAGEAQGDKPTRHPVDFAFQDFSITPSRSMWFIGDMEADVECAREAGMTSILVKSEAYTGPVKPDHHFPCLESLSKQL